MGNMKLSEDLKNWRIERPDEWKMDEFIRLAQELEQRQKTDQPLGSAICDLTKIAELGQAYAHFELIRTLATQAQTRYGKHLDQSGTDRMGEIARDSDYIISKIMAAFDAAK